MMNITAVKTMISVSKPIDFNLIQVEIVVDVNASDSHISAN